MKSLDRRLNRLEDRLAPASGRQIVVSLYDAGHKLALDHDTRGDIERNGLEPVSYSGIVSAKDSSGDVAGQPTMTRKTSRTKRAMARSFQSVARDEFGHS